MLDGYTRWILFFDMAMAPHPSDAQPIPLRELIGPLKKRVDDGKAIKTIDGDRRVLRVNHLQFTKARSGADVAVFLFSISDLDSADPSFQHIVTGKVRTEAKRPQEGGAVTVHALMRLDPYPQKGHVYQVVYEDVAGLGRSRVQELLRSEFKHISEELDLRYERESGSLVKTRPMVELAGHQSEMLKEALRAGRLLGFELWDDEVKSRGFDEQKYVKRQRRELKISVTPDLTRSEAAQAVEQVKIWGRQNDYGQMRVRWQSPSSSKPEATAFPTAKADAGEAMFVRQVEVRVSTPLPQGCESIRNDLVQEMFKVMEEK